MLENSCILTPAPPRPPRPRKAEVIFILQIRKQMEAASLRAHSTSEAELDQD